MPTLCMRHIVDDEKTDPLSLWLTKTVPSRTVAIFAEVTALLYLTHSSSHRSQSKKALPLAQVGQGVLGLCTLHEGAAYPS